MIELQWEKQRVLHVKKKKECNRKKSAFVLKVREGKELLRMDMTKFSISILPVGSVDMLASLCVSLKPWTAQMLEEPLKRLNSGI